MPLSDAQIRRLKPAARAVKVSDGGGLHLMVTPQGSKLWRLAYRHGGKQKLLALGSYPVVGLADARERRLEAKRSLEAGLDPSHQVKVEKIRKQTAHANTFRAIADEYLKKGEREGRAEVTTAKKRWLLSLADPDIGARPITEITAPEILIPLRRVEAQGNYETARRLRATVGQVFRFAIATARAENDPTFGLRGALTAPKVQHRAAFTRRQDLGRLIRAIWTYEGRSETQAALKLMALLYPRPGELRQAEWAEFDLKVGVWAIPASRTKMRREHRKPLSAEAAAILKDLRQLTGHRALAFPSLQSAFRPMSENTLNGAIRRMGFKATEATSHGFRATASSLLNESGLWHADAIEAELGHAGKDEVRRAYHRATYWDERVKMAEWWADQVLALK